MNRAQYVVFQSLDIFSELYSPRLNFFMHLYNSLPSYIMSSASIHSAPWAQFFFNYLIVFKNMEFVGTGLTE